MQIHFFDLSLLELSNVQNITGANVKSHPHLLLFYTT